MIETGIPVMIIAPSIHAFRSTNLYCRHRPKRTVLYSIIAEHCPRFVQEIERSGGHLPGFVRQEFEDCLKCGLLEHGFLRVKCDGCRNEHLVAFSCKRRGLFIADPADPYLEFAVGSSLDQYQAASINYRIAI